MKLTSVQKRIFNESDQQLRELERRWKESGSIQDFDRYYLKIVQRGMLPQTRPEKDLQLNLDLVLRGIGMIEDVKSGHMRGRMIFHAPHINPKELGMRLDRVFDVISSNSWHEYSDLNSKWTIWLPIAPDDEWYDKYNTSTGVGILHLWAPESSNRTHVIGVSCGHDINPETYRYNRLRLGV